MSEETPTPERKNDGLPNTRTPAGGKPEEGRYSNERDRETGVAPLAPREFLRWTWRQLTSMRTALILLFLLALGSVPGSVIPQDAVDSLASSRWRDQHPSLTPLYEKLSLFSVYTSPWFSAIYVLLMISLVGCILPRARVYFKALRARPPKTPKNLSRLPEYRTFEVDAEPAEVLAKAKTFLGGYRKDLTEASIAAEKGYLREAGNLLFHLSVLVVLVGFATGSLFGYKGGVVVVTGGKFANISSQYDDFNPGRLFQVKNLKPFSFSITDFDVTFITTGRSAGQASDFSAGVDYQTSPTAAAKHTRIKVNHPLNIDGSKIYLIGHGYAPRVTVRNTSGAVVYDGPTVFLPEDATFLSQGVIKVPDASPSQLGFSGVFFPTYASTKTSGPFSAFPDDKNPILSLFVYSGDLGMNSGQPQSVYALDMAGLKQVKSDGKDLRIDLQVGETYPLPNGLGSITFDGVSRFVKLQVSHNPDDWMALLGMIMALTGLLGSLFIKPRRIWVSVRRDGARTLVEVAGLDRSSGGDLSGEVDDLAALLEENA
ncbi:MAG TPA: cytochrome c biogenesis protein ResB [Marmoricola sp.]|jgi:cytochrome c biogenesis protein|nr:cytochrome c biogenesis protein ResB [Marmoricola sp.]